MSRFNIRKPRNDAPLQASDVRPKSEVYSNDFLSAFWPEEERAKRSPQGDNRSSADVSRFNIRKPRSDQQFDPSERRPKSEVYSPDFLHSFWPEEDKYTPRPTGRKVRKGARPFLEHDASCQWMEYMSHPAKEPVSLAKEQPANGLFPGDAPSTAHQQGDHAPKSDPAYLREQRLSCSPDGGTVYLKETALQRRPASQQEHREPRRHSASPEKGTAEWYQSQVSLLEEQQRKLFEQQKNLMAIMSSHRGVQQTAADESPESSPVTPTLSPRNAVTPSITHHDMHQVDQTFNKDPRAFHQPDQHGSDFSLPAESSISIVSHEDSPCPQASRFRHNSAKSRKYEETMGRDIRMSMSGRVVDLEAEQTHDDSQPLEGPQPAVNYSRHGAGSGTNLLERRVSQMSVTSQQRADVSSSRSDVSHGEEEAGSGFDEPKRVKRLKGDCAAANAVRMEGSADRLIYYKKKPTSGDDEEVELIEEAKIFDMNQPLERSKSHGKYTNNCPMLEGSRSTARATDSYQPLDRSPCNDIDNFQSLERPTSNIKSSDSYQPLERSMSNVKSTEDYQPLDRSPSESTHSYQPLESSPSNAKATDIFQPLDRSPSKVIARDNYRPLEGSPSNVRNADSYKPVKRSTSNAKATDNYQPLDNSPINARSTDSYKPRESLSSNVKVTDNYRPLERSPSKATHNCPPIERSPSNAKASDNFKRPERSSSNAMGTDHFQSFERSPNVKATRSFQPSNRQRVEDTTEKALTGASKGKNVPHWLKGKSPSGAKSTGKTARSPTSHTSSSTSHAPSSRRETPTSGRSTPAGRQTKPLSLSSRSSTTGNLKC